MQSLANYWRQQSRPIACLFIFSLAHYFCITLIQSLFSSGSDFQLMYHAAFRLVHGGGNEIYKEFFAYRPGGDGHFYMYPPIAAMFYKPFALLSYRTAWIIFQVLSHLALWCTIGFWIWWKRSTPEKALLAASLVLLFSPMSFSLQIGQSEPFILLALIAAFALNERNFSFLAGFLLACCMGLKIFLALLLVDFILAKRYRLFIYTASWWVFLNGLSLGSVVVWVQRSYWLHALSGIGIETFLDNHSITASVYQLCTLNAYTRGLVDMPTVAKLLTGFLGGCVLLRYVWVARQLHHAQEDARALALCFATMLLITPHADTHHFALLLFPFLSLLFKDQLSWVTVSVYSFFAIYQPITMMPLLAEGRLIWWTTGIHALIFSVPCLVLLLWWWLLPLEKYQR